MATFTLQVLMQNSDLLLKYDFLFGCSHYLFKCGLSTDCCVNSSRSWSYPHAQLIIDDITPIDHATMVFTEATMATGTAGLYGLMRKIVCGGSRQICERVTSWRRKRRKKIWMLMMALGSQVSCNERETRISKSSYTHTLHMVFLTLKKSIIYISLAATAVSSANVIII